VREFRKCERGLLISKGIRGRRLWSSVFSKK